MSEQATGGVIVQESKTSFVVLLPFGTVLGSPLFEFLNRYLGQWTIARGAEEASMQVLLARNGVFPGCDVDRSEYLFKRDGRESKVYEFDPFENKLVAVTPQRLAARRQKL